MSIAMRTRASARAAPTQRPAARLIAARSGPRAIIRAQAVCQPGRQPQQQQQQQQQPSILQRFGAAAASLAIAAAAVAAPLPASAELVQTVPVSQVTQMAKALPKQEIDKGKVWTAFIGGAAALFIGTVLAENNGAWFPAIARANEAMAVSRKRAQQAEAAEVAEGAIEARAEPTPRQPAAAPAAAPVRRPPPPPREQPPPEVSGSSTAAAGLTGVSTAELEAELARQTRAVEEGLLAARTKVLGEQPPPASSSSSNGAGAGQHSSASSSSSSSAPAASTSSSTGSSSSGGGSQPAPAAYAVVTEVAAAPDAVAWQGGADAGQSQPGGAEAAAAAAAQQPQPGSGAAASLAGVLEGRELLHEFRAQQAALQAEQREGARQ